MAEGGSSGVLMSMAMTRSAPIWRAMSTGRLRTSPPSTRRRPSISIGATSPGRLMLPRRASARLPRLRTTIVPVPMSVVTARNGTGRASKSVTPAAPDPDLDIHQVGELFRLVAVHNDLGPAHRVRNTFLL